MKKDLKTQPESYWKEKLTPEEYKVLREKATDLPFTGAYTDHHGTGVYTCRACGQELFSSTTKYDAHCGWPSFYEALDKTKVEFHEDTSHGMQRTEITCSNCGSHLGHIFDQQSTPSGMWYCVNSTSLEFAAKK